MTKRCLHVSLSPTTFSYSSLAVDRAFVLQIWSRAYAAHTSRCVSLQNIFRHPCRNLFLNLRFDLFVIRFVSLFGLVRQILTDPGLGQPMLNVCLPSSSVTFLFSPAFSPRDPPPVFFIVSGLSCCAFDISPPSWSFPCFLVGFSLGAELTFRLLVFSRFWHFSCGGTPSIGPSFWCVLNRSPRSVPFTSTPLEGSPLSPAPFFFLLFSCRSCFARSSPSPKRCLFHAVIPFGRCALGGPDVVRSWQGPLSFMRPLRGRPVATCPVPAGPASFVGRQPFFRLSVLGIFLLQTS